MKQKMWAFITLLQVLAYTKEAESFVPTNRLGTSTSSLCSYKSTLSLKINPTRCCITTKDGHLRLNSHTFGSSSWLLDSNGNACGSGEYDSAKSLDEKGLPETLLNRRSMISGAASSTIFLAATSLFPISTYAASSTDQTQQQQLPFKSPLIDPINTKLENGLLTSRLTENVLSPPPYGMESNDIIYPSYFTGVWDVTSTTKSIQAPCGIALFGGNSTYLKAKEEINTSLEYRARFVKTGGNDENAASRLAGNSIADREFNVREIVKQAMGAQSVVDVSLATPNKFSCLLNPNGAGTMFTVDMIALARRYEQNANVDAGSTQTQPQEFVASEVVRQIVYNTNNNGAKPQQRGATLLKEIESISLYTPVYSSNTKEGEKEIVNEIRCKQRSATYLLPSQDDPMMYKIWQATQGRPIDVRFYDLVYTQRQPKA